MWQGFFQLFSQFLSYHCSMSGGFNFHEGLASVRLATCGSPFEFFMSCSIRCVLQGLHFVKYHRCEQFPLALNTHSVLPHHKIWCLWTISNHGIGWKKKSDILSLWVNIFTVFQRKWHWAVQAQRSRSAVTCIVKPSSAVAWLVWTECVWTMQPSSAVTQVLFTMTALERVQVGTQLVGLCTLLWACWLVWWSCGREAICVRPGG